MLHHCGADHKATTAPLAMAKRKQRAEVVDIQGEVEEAAHDQVLIM
jgi:hypothetical protein